MDLGTAQSLVSQAWDAATSNSMSWGDKSDQARAALSAFWAGKAESYQEDPTAWDRLDLSAHKAWAALAEVGMVADNPPAQQRYQDEAQRAYQGAQALAAQLGDAASGAALARNSGNSAAWFDEATKHGVDDSMAAALHERVSQLGGILESLASIPWWAWLGAGVGVLWLLYGRKS